MGGKPAGFSCGTGSEVGGSTVFLSSACSLSSYKENVRCRTQSDYEARLEGLNLSGVQRSFALQTRRFLLLERVEEVGLLFLQWLVAPLPKRGEARPAALATYPRTS